MLELLFSGVARDCSDINSRFCKCCFSCMLSGVMAFLCFFFILDFVFNLVYLCVSRSAVWAVRPRVRQMRRLLWWALTTVIRLCLFASVCSSEITAAPRRANKPVARSEFIFLLALYCFLCIDGFNCNIDAFYFAFIVWISHCCKEFYLHAYSLHGDDHNITYTGTSTVMCVIAFTAQDCGINSIVSWLAFIHS